MQIWGSTPNVVPLKFGVRGEDFFPEEDDDEKDDEEESDEKSGEKAVQT